MTFAIGQEGTALAGTRYTIAVTQGCHARKYVAHIPACAAPGHPLPLVLALHGSGGNAESFLDEANWGAAAERYGFIVIAPEALPLNPALPTASLANPRVWNSGQYGSLYPCSKTDDVGFLVGVLDDAGSRWSVDVRRVYAAGFSNGGAMVFRFAAERADRVTAMVSVSGLCWVPKPQPSRSIPTLMMYGDLDPLVPSHGGLRVLPWEVQPSPPVSTVADRWAIANGCDPTPRNAGTLPGCHVKVEDRVCAAGGLVRLYRVGGQGHAWPGGHGARPERLIGPDLSKLDATSAACEFFLQWSW